jgi:hypothetical protein
MCFMHALIEQNPIAIDQLCRRYGVRRLDAFGSVLRDDFDPQRSDVDFVVEFVDTSPRGAADRYFGLLFGLEELLRRRVDLVMSTAVTNSDLRDEIERSRVPIHAAA